MAPRVPRYLDRFVAQQNLRSANAGLDRHIHLGYWDDPEAAASAGSRDIVSAQRRYDAVLRDWAALDAPGTRSVLDVGCGVGGTVEAVLAQAPGSTVVGLNLDSRQLALAERRVRPPPGSEVRWVCADACALPWDRPLFDRVFAVECAFHFASRERFASEVARVLQPGGLLIGSDFGPSPALRALHDTHPSLAGELHAILDVGLGPWPDPWCVAPAFPEALTAAGFTVTRFADVTAHTLPSYADFLDGADMGWFPRCEVAPEALAFALAALLLPIRRMDPVDASVALLGALQTLGGMRTVCFVARNEASRAISTP